MASAVCDDGGALGDHRVGRRGNRAPARARRDQEGIM